MADFPDPMPGSVFCETPLVYACLAFHPVVDGHTIVAVKRSDIDDINNLPPEEISHLLRVVFRVVRPALLQCYGTDKVYVTYLDEIRRPHFHLFPRIAGGKMGFELLNQPHGELTDLSPVAQLKQLCAQGPG